MALIEGLEVWESRCCTQAASSVIADKARERLCIEPSVRFLLESHDTSHDRMDLDERWARWIQVSIGVGAVNRFFMPTIQGLRRLDHEILHDDQRFNSLDQKARESAEESALVTRRFTLS